MKFLLLFLLLLFIHSCKLENTEKPIRFSHIGDTFHNWKQCYEEDASDTFVVKTAQVELVKNPHDSSDPIPFIKLHATLHSPIQQPDLKMNQIFYSYSIWNEETGQKVTYKGDNFDICCGFLTNSSTASQQSLYCEHSDWNCPSGVGDFDVSISKPIWKTKSGNYEASLVIFQYKSVEPIISTNATDTATELPSISVEKDELVCIDIPFALHFKPLAHTTEENHDKKVSIFRSNEVPLEL